MSVESSKVVDAISIDPGTDKVVLTISDHLGWEDEYEHLRLLQDKINAYLAFVESGEVYRKYTKATGRRAEIRVVAKFPPTEKALEFFSTVGGIVRAAGFDLQCEVFGSGPVRTNRE